MPKTNTRYLFIILLCTEDDLTKRPNEWKNKMENTGIRLNMNKTKVIINGEWQRRR